MPALKHQKHEAFAQAVAEGLSATAAYQQHVARPGSKRESCSHEGRLLLAKEPVAARVKELRVAFAEVLEHRLGVRRETMARYLLDILETPADEVGPESPLAQEFKRSRKLVGRGEQAQEWEVEQVKMPCKLSALDKLNKMSGWYEPEQAGGGGKLLEIIIKKQS